MTRAPLQEPLNAHFVAEINPRSVNASQFGDLTRFSKSVAHNGALLDQFDDKRVNCDKKETIFELKDGNQKISLYEIYKIFFLF